MAMKCCHSKTRNKFEAVLKSWTTSEIHNLRMMGETRCTLEADHHE